MVLRVLHSRISLLFTPNKQGFPYTPAAHRGGLREAHSFTNGGQASYCTRSDREYSICGFVISLSYAKLCLGLWDTANHRSDEAPAGVELTCPGMTDDVLYKYTE